MKIVLTDKFQKDILGLEKKHLEPVLSVMLKVPTAVKNIHLHGGVGLRKIHPSGIFEARVGLGLRLIFGYKDDEIYFHRLGNHDDIRKYLKNL